MGIGEFNEGGDNPCDGLTSHPGGVQNTPSHFHATEIGISCGPMRHLARMQTLPYLAIEFRK